MTAGHPGGALDPADAGAGDRSSSGAPATAWATAEERLREFRVRHALKIALACCLCVLVPTLLQIQSIYMCPLFAFMLLTGFYADSLAAALEALALVLVAAAGAVAITALFDEAPPLHLALMLAWLFAITLLLDRFPLGALMGGIIVAMLLFTSIFVAETTLVGVQPPFPRPAADRDGDRGRGRPSAMAAAPARGVPRCAGDDLREPGHGLRPPAREQRRRSERAARAAAAARARAGGPVLSRQRAEPGQSAGAAADPQQRALAPPRVPKAGMAPGEAAGRRRDARGRRPPAGRHRRAVPADRRGCRGPHARPAGRAVAGRERRPAGRACARAAPGARRRAAGPGPQLEHPAGAADARAHGHPPGRGHPFLQPRGGPAREPAARVHRGSAAAAHRRPRRSSAAPRPC